LVGEEGAKHTQSELSSHSENLGEPDGVDPDSQFQFGVPCDKVNREVYGAARLKRSIQMLAPAAAPITAATSGMVSARSDPARL
jgi:hypothetical protein